jgi:hypothetical protein
VIVPPFFVLAAGVAVLAVVLSLLPELEPQAATTMPNTTGRASLFTTRLLRRRSMEPTLWAAPWSEWRVWLERC